MVHCIHQDRERFGGVLEEGLLHDKIVKDSSHLIERDGPPSLGGILLSAIKEFRRAVPKSPYERSLEGVG